MVTQKPELRYTLTAIANWQMVCYGKPQPSTDDALLECTSVLLNMLKAIGLPVIRPDNYREVFRRLMVLEMVHGPMRFHQHGCGQPKPFTLAEVRSHVGLYSNGPTLSENKFWKQVQARIHYRTQEELAYQEKLTHG